MFDVSLKESYAQGEGKREWGGEETEGGGCQQHGVITERQEAPEE